MKKAGQLFKALGLSLVAALILAACTQEATTQSLELSFDGLEPLQNGFHYEGWVIVDDKPVTTGKFNIDADGNTVDLDGNAVTSFSFAKDLVASKVVISIEPTGDTDTVPAATKVLAGDVTDGKATLNTGIVADFSAAEGTYFLKTPTSDVSADTTSGIWFIDAGQPGLTLPTLSAGWKYEGWVVLSDAGPVTTGRFTDVAAADDFSGFSGPNDGPPFPGEDFLTNAPAGLTFPTDLSGKTVVISVEPDADDTTAPYTLKPLVGTAPTNAVQGVNYNLGLNLDSLPTATATIK